jgi:hypothetical protein
MTAEDPELVLLDAARAYERALGDRLIAAYALGSLAHGGFAPLVSDIDLGLILADPPHPGDAAAIRAVAEAETAKPSGLARRLSVFWGTHSTLAGRAKDGRFPPFDRADLVDHGRLLLGTEARAGVPRPDARQLLIGGAEFALALIAGSELLRRPELLAAAGVLRLTKLVLAPVRFLFMAETGAVAAADTAAAWYLERAGAPSTELVGAARGWRITEPADPVRVTALLDAQLVSLYLHYIDDHIARLDDLAESSLSAAFGDWRARLGVA